MVGSIINKICCIYLSVTSLLECGCGLLVTGVIDDLARRKCEGIGAIRPLFPFLLERFIPAAVYSVKIIALVAEKISQ